VPRHRLPQRPDRLGLVAGGEHIALQVHADQALEAVAAGKALAGLPLLDGALAHAGQGGQELLTQAGPFAESERQLAKGMIPGPIRAAAFHRPAR
jgi:hypothetical protein